MTTYLVACLHTRARLVLCDVIKRFSPFFPVSASIRATTCHTATHNANPNGYHYHHKPTFLLFISFVLHRHKHKPYQFCTPLKRPSPSTTAEVQQPLPHDSGARSSQAKRMGWHAYRQSDDQYKPQPSPAQAANLSSDTGMKQLLSHLVKTGCIKVESLALV
jgi:hypothetical protein